MQEYAFLIAIAGVLLVGAMSPGPSFLVVAQNSLAKSRTHGVATAFGTGIGVAIFALLASVGVTTLLEKVPSVYMAFKLFGGAYLLYLAYQIWSGAKQALPIANQNTVVTHSLSKSFLMGLVTQTSNPKTALVIAGIFAAFVPANPPANTSVLVALIAFIIDFSWYSLVAFTLSVERSKIIYAKAKTNFDRTASVFLGFVGIKLMMPIV